MSECQLENNLEKERGEDRVNEDKNTRRFLDIDFSPGF